MPTTDLPVRKRIKRGLITQAEDYSIHYGDQELSISEDLMALCPDRNGDIILCMIKEESFQLGITVQSSIS